MRALWNGPYVVIKVLSSVTYRVGRCPNSNKWKVVHLDKLRRYTPRESVDFSWLDNLIDSNDSLEPSDEVDLAIEIDEDEVDVRNPAPLRGGSSTDVPTAPSLYSC